MNPYIGISTRRRYAVARLSLHFSVHADLRDRRHTQAAPINAPSPVHSLCPSLSAAGQ
jgi:hypothetical protein